MDVKVTRRYYNKNELFSLMKVFYFLPFLYVAGPELESFVLFRIVEVLHSAFSAGHIQIADHISFFITLLSRFKVTTGMLV